MVPSINPVSQISNILPSIITDVSKTLGIALNSLALLIFYLFSL